MFFGRASAGEHPSRSYDQTLQLHRLLVAGTKTGGKNAWRLHVSGVRQVLQPA